ncbi:hypothetical protein GCM10010371_44790 [Streptomyces subrutilus]|uniref:Asp23/Gls24 family envelope stress response protein n=1 Tax=Streptomyces subrutilus TaxID=36818 RepID=A0A918R166_9ACTN|nr:Asp23/Gls24 family envelope stress response protein [Streptomyces subrutilus]GGZ80312.1 hypothetical protein GCM10010371_44790 [Streptomyces subrutilus]
MAMSVNPDRDRDPDEPTGEPGGERAGGLADASPGAFPDDELLPCGRDLAALWEEPLSGADRAHTSVCPHCTAALDDLARLRDAVRPDPRPGDGDGGAGTDAAALVERIMGVVRLELRPGRTLPLGEPDEDGWIYEAVAAKVLRSAADSVPGVRSGSCRIRPEPGGRGPVHVHIEVTVGAARALRERAQRVRRRVRDAADAELGMEVASVDVAVTDLHEEPEQEDGA